MRENWATEVNYWKVGPHIIAVASRNERQQGIPIECSIFLGTKCCSEPVKLHYSHCDTMAGKLITLFGGREFWAWCCTIEVWPERGKNQHGRLCSKLEHGRSREEWAALCMVDGIEILVLRKVHLTSTLSWQFNYYYQQICYFNQCGQFCWLL